MQPKMETMTERVHGSLLHKLSGLKNKQAQNCLSADPNDCLVWCLVEVPAEYKTITKQVNKGCDGSGVANSGCVKRITYSC